MRYIEQLTQDELDNYFFNFYKRIITKMKAIRVIKQQDYLSITIWNTRNGLQGFTFSDFTYDLNWVKFLYKRFGTEYLKDFEKHQLSVNKSKYKKELKKLKLQAKLDSTGTLKNSLKLKIKRLKEQYELSNNILQREINKIKEKEMNAEK